MRPLLLEGGIKKKKMKKGLYGIPFEGEEDELEKKKRREAVVANPSKGNSGSAVT